MKISMKLIRDSLGMKSLEVNEVAQTLTSLGLEVEAIETNQIDGLVVGHVLEKVKHPESTKLSICQVDLGKLGKTQIVCGAQNVDAGQNVIVATVGTKLSPDFVIGVRKVVGVESAGMICSMSEVGQPQLQKYDGIYNFEGKVKVGNTDPLGLLGVEVEEVIELSLTPNRSDCLGLYQILRELSAYYEKELRFKIDRDDYEDAKTAVNARIASPDVNAFVLGKYENITIKESSEVIQETLEVAGIKTINNIVDATNYAMLMTGQPLHAFDADKVANGLTVTNDRTGKFIGLDDNEYEVTKNDIVIMHGDEIAALAGIMGSKAHGVTIETKNILVEAANFDHIKIKNTATRLNLFTQSATRFIKCLDTNNVFAGQNEFAKAIGSRPQYKTIKGKIVKDWAISITKQKVNSYFGSEPQLSKILRQLKTIGVDVKEEKGDYAAIIDSIRIDIQNDVDVIEEIMRFYGVDNIEPMAPVQQVALYENEDNSNVVIGRYKNFLQSKGLNEVRTYSLTSLEKCNEFSNEENIVKLAHPMSDERAVMRTSLITSLIDVVAHNQNRSLKDVMIYEFAKTYTKDKVNSKLAIAVSGTYYNAMKSETSVVWSYSLLKELVEKMLLQSNISADFVKAENKNLHPGQSANIVVNGKVVGIIGKVHPTYAQSNKLEDIWVCELNDIAIEESKTKYNLVSNTNPITKDVALVFDMNVTFKGIKDCLATIQDINNIKVVDIYKSEQIGKDKQSITISFDLDKYNHSFSSKEIEAKLREVIMKLHDELGGQHEWAN